MSHRLSVSLPDRLYDDIGAAARRAGLTRAAWIRRKLDRSFGAADSLHAHLSPGERRRLVERRARVLGALPE